ncbi:MAG: Oligoendopeptidase F [uncultured Solirubrobacteraceae bacterium]|uniref:Oligoendopeptidase F n=1 Tax=uncultured Solirubrobacteraceae bacterium TaxID=1162706 RepID=A0A6J4T5W7_9ACTN|nr:MAG: Oligoendopeptidase F [uncultured Solirubrobacteraceae bacterium]
MTATELADVAWNLDDLVGADGPVGVDALLDESAERAAAFNAAYAGRVADLDGPGLAQAIADLAAIADAIGRAGNYASLRFSTDTADPVNGALIAKVQERGTAIETQLLFFDLEWADVDDATADELLRADGLEQARHHLRAIRRYRPYLLSEPEEKILAEKSQSGSAAWSRLFEELTSAVEVETPEGKVALDVALSRLSSPDREVRRSTQEVVTVALRPGLRTRAYIFNTLLLDKSVDDRLRGYPSWLSARNLSNEASDESVQALLEAVKGSYELPQRWYRLKARLFGLDRLADYDRAASVAEVDEEIGWDDARDIVLGSFDAFSPVLGNTARRFFDERWIDAPVRPAKRGGAFCAYTVPSVHPYVLLNYTSKRRDVLTLAHELGHGLHAALAQGRGPFEQHTPLTLAETASVFGETLVFKQLLEATSDPASRLSLLAENIEGSIATVFRQTAMNQFEERAHLTRRTEGELSVERIGDLWAESQHELLGDAVEVTDNYKAWWSYVPHFIATPGYVYAYAYGQLLALSVYGQYLERGEAFVPAYVELLSAGGSRSPEELAAIAGLDLADPGFWQSGIALVRGQLEAAEAVAEEVMAQR